MRLTALFCTFCIVFAVGCCSVTPRPMEITEDQQSRIDRIERAAVADRYVYRVYGQHGMGSAVPITSNLLLTCDHVVADNEPEHLWIKRGDSIWTVTEIIPFGTVDAALLRVKAPLPGANPAIEVPPRRYDELELGEMVTMTGHALDNPAAIIVEGVYAGMWRFTLYAIDGTIIPGMSGGPVFDMNGELIGICQAVTNNPYGRKLGLVLPLTTLNRRMNDLGYPDDGTAEGPPD